ncbi:tyrosine-protein phosphatase [Pseudomonas bohemica]|uniref:tyrosine-protein phosphatase n=1 Tax=Pseudomonas bohemica TaxID=2044872 RepID=UPI000DA5EE30|nr:tyrosine-protein phosphatase [Pseudomonas bohemica]
MTTPCNPSLANADSLQTLRLSGTDNFRSLMGMPTASGQRIAGHAVLRSDQLHQLDESAWLTLKELGVKTVCDLRSLGERERYPNRLPEHGLRQLILEVIADVRADPGFVERLAEDPSAENAENMMLDIYRRFPAMLAPHLAALFGLFESGDVPVLIHCAAGKDRTGFAVAMLLHGLGVSQADILSDYQRSGRRFADLDPVRQEAMAHGVFRLARQSVSEAAMDTVLDARPSYLLAAFESIHRQYGSIDEYLQAHAGLDRTALARLRARWLTPSLE